MKQRGLGRFDGSYHQYFHTGTRREHQAWDSLCVRLREGRGVAFPAVELQILAGWYPLRRFSFRRCHLDALLQPWTGRRFLSYGDYYNGHQDDDAITYLTLANKLIHEVNPHAVTIAEEVSGMPGLAVKVADGGYGFDYRMAMNIGFLDQNTEGEER